jgi:ethanolamine ammonia-lyase small subunit
MPTGRQLELQEALALARNAVQAEFAATAIAAELRALGIDSIECWSAAPDRGTYLQRPDLGRRLAPQSKATLASRQEDPVDVALVVADGLSAQATRCHSAALLGAIRDLLPAANWKLSPAVLVHQGRVAIGDEVGELLKAQMVAVLIGERPGLSSIDSLGVYVTWAPHVGCRDAERNCISNIRSEGLPIVEAARRLASTLASVRAHQMSGVGLGEALAAGEATQGLPAGVQGFPKLSTL